MSLLRFAVSPRYSQKNNLLKIIPSFRHFSSPFPINVSSKKTSVNPNEIAHFNALASSWWDYNGPSRLLHLMNPLRHDFIARCYNSNPTNNTCAMDHQLRYLDVGCGGGIFAESAARLSCVKNVTAIDPSLDVLNVARAHARRDPSLIGKLEYRNASIEDLPEPASSTDQYHVLTLFEVIEHITYPASFLEQCTKFVRPGGWIIMSTVARTWLSWFTTILVAEYGLRIVPPGTHEWSSFINADELKNWFMDQRGWSKPVVSGVVYIPGIGWRFVDGSEKIGNYFLGIRRDI
ncbi:Ubiquinone biosynthesis O-methyltransferase, mitochondrial [Golovinomyces cichoracearum]|uniref:Ubiquinone biosynthesis O-methyltransferase, mitochondrial n=1 Tax=Golovinomyces cichoracearum TaxID=62708 RepID=A0A420J6K3_9PEZI|nr:Ubiquinone biosynthesis O-methyltransferase, mitochondrial [Golovinomyces cichoracearum]